jgi:hypothetical protein
MYNYTYPNVAITDLGIVAVKIKRLLGVSPTGLSDAGDRTDVMFADELTTQQKTNLDSFMAGTNLDVIPTTTNTVYRINTMDDIKTASGLDFDMYPTSDSGITLVFQKVLTSQEKNALKGAFANVLQQTQ